MLRVWQIFIDESQSIALLNGKQRVGLNNSIFFPRLGMLSSAIQFNSINITQF